MAQKATVDERIDTYADFCFDVGTLVKAYAQDGSSEMKAKAFDKLVKRWQELAKKVTAWE